MAIGLNFGDKLNFNKIDLTPANTVLQNIGQQLLGATEGCVLGVVEEYSGPIVSYTKKSMTQVLAETAGTATRKVDIQNELGKLGDRIQRYEFYLQTPIYEDYKYRILFFEFGTGYYPVKVVLESGVAEEILGPYESYITSCQSPSELEDLIQNILFSKHVLDVMQELIHVYQIKSEELVSEE